MNAHASQTSENKSPATSFPESKKQNKEDGTAQLIDNRPGVIAQRRLQDMANNSPQTHFIAQLQRMADSQNTPIQKKKNDTGLPDQLKTGIENLSGYSMDDVRVHRNSAQPAQLQAHAFAQGTDIHIASGQEQHLPHEAWHVVQQMQGRVRPTMQLKGKVNINDDAGLEKEADVMGQKAIHTSSLIASNHTHLPATSSKNQIQQKAIDVVQMRRDELEAYEIGFTQASIGASFTSVPEGVHKRLGKLEAAAAQIDKGKALPAWIQGIRVFSIKNPADDEERIFSLDNRRLKVIKLSTLGNKVKIPVQWADLPQVIAECFKFTNRESWTEAEMTDMPTAEQRTIAPTGNLLGDFFAALVADGYVNAQGVLTGAGASNVVNNWNFNQAE